ncbi:HAD family hydrolase [Azohydromonas caseinilytica]|uniref:HAD family hydrolase n=1 Tax=Azohydromonas caseinilytica TaxID=2728836 RepID=A0A848FC48_9BURK|nr:HAD family hydrolase [Azohydromonas caseinilytica]NML17777.1 HAD family hydrolase [Azohydromonas caseinilytica]
MRLTHASDLLRLVRRLPSLRVLSIDLFDTLVYRRVNDPTDVFRLQYRQGAGRGLLGAMSEADWLRERKDTEHRLARAAAPHEIQLAEVYADIQRRLGLSDEAAAALLALELDIERSVIAPYEEVVDALAQIRRAGVEVVVLTDTYLPPAFIRDVIGKLLRCPATVLCSSETQAPKRTGLAFQELLRRYGPRGVLHVGDNLNVDVRRARRVGVRGVQTLWARQRWSQEHAWLAQYAHARGLCAWRTPHDAAPGEADSASVARATLAQRWAVVLADFTLALREEARRVGATDIWFLSRDCESIWQAVSSLPGFFDDRHGRYVLCSRASGYPVMAARQDARFARWTGRAATPADVAAGESAIAYYGAQLRPQTRHVLLVDMGWKGRLQAAIAAALPQVRVSGFYFSLEPGAEVEAQVNGSTFLPWNPQVFNQAVVEALAGFREASCEGFAQATDGTLLPRLRSRLDDVAPADYCRELRESLGLLLEGAPRGRAPDPGALRREAVARVCAYPDAATATALRTWAVATRSDASDAASLVDGGGTSWLARLLCRPVPGNVWPRGAVWSLTGSSRMVRLLHAAHDAQLLLRRRLKPLLRPGRLPTRAAAQAR